jgi:hypothetical protein
VGMHALPLQSTSYVCCSGQAMATVVAEFQHAYLMNADWIVSPWALDVRCSSPLAAYQPISLLRTRT